MPFTTEAFVLEQVNSDFKLETVELDDPQDEEVLVEGRPTNPLISFALCSLLLYSRRLWTLP